MSKPKKDTLRGTPTRTLTSAIGVLVKGVEVDAPAGEVGIWLAETPPAFVLAPEKTPTRAKASDA